MRDFKKIKERQKADYVMLSKDVEEFQRLCMDWEKALKEKSKVQSLI